MIGSNKIEHLNSFLQQTNIAQLVSMFDLLPDMLFWIKNTDSQIIYANSAFQQHIGANSLEQAIGLTDYDFAPPHLARQYVVDDQRVMAGQTVDDRLEMNILKNGELRWFTTSKRILLDQHQQVIGTYGVSRHLEKTSLALTGMQAVKIPVEYIRANYMHDICIVKLAELSHLSISALERRFKKYLNKTPKQFINEVRLENARRLLIETTLPIAMIASECGFADPSYFTRQFTKLFDEKPSDFRLSFNTG
ncbi:AraC family transcriptional regulator [Catenovulum agarivorans DS-2]|uniref:AraC family transcriptional regulator n=1 Tax=Catenovulum agarivorans DS-2 TaxID=1328313 RepID=W7QQX4_9ALTE|nr:AraC family transcriptional regulator [Catenovulum agarivorans]EWH11402.1 AraC family transcriptional regulator [Catenovulum agarivorans DS-2]